MSFKKYSEEEIAKIVATTLYNAKPPDDSADLIPFLCYVIESFFLERQQLYYREDMEWWIRKHLLNKRSISGYMKVIKK
jgi:hypothetical protein